MPAAVLAVLVAACASCWAENPKQRSHRQWIPNALVLVMTGLGPNEQVSIAYPDEVSAEQARQDATTLSEAGNWRLQNFRTATGPSGLPGGKGATSASFETSGIVDVRNGTLHLEPFIIALKRFGSIEVMFVNVPDMSFAGPKDFEDRFVKITFSRQDGSYRYRARIKNAAFEKLDILSGAGASDPSSARRSYWRTVLIVAVAVFAAVAVYAATACLTRRRRA